MGFSGIFCLIINEAHSAQNSRINGPSDWLPTDASSAVIQAGFGGAMRAVTAIHTQGAGVNGAYVKQYKIRVGVNGSWRYIKNYDGEDLVFDGNTDGNTIVTNLLPEPVEAIAVALYVVDYFSAPALRWAVLGCPTE